MPSHSELPFNPAGTALPGSVPGSMWYLSTTKSDSQTIMITDLISEGPIFGLVNGAASCFLNNDRIVGLEQASQAVSKTGTTITLTNGQTSATINNYSLSSAITDILTYYPGYGYKLYLNVKKGLEGGKNVTATYKSRKEQTLTTSSSYFTDAMITSVGVRGNPSDIVPARLVGIPGTSTTPDGLPIEGFIHSKVSTTEALWRTGQYGDSLDFKIDDGTYSLQIDKVIEISSTSGNNVTLASAWTGASGTYSFDNLGIHNSIFGSDEEAYISQKYQGAQVAFRTGTLFQTPLPGSGGVGSTAKSNSPNIELKKVEGDVVPTNLQGSSNTGFNLSSAQLEEVDTVRININYPSGLRAISGKGNDQTTHIRYKFEISLLQNSTWSSNVTIRDGLVHTGLFVNAVTFEEEINLEKYRPFDDFKIIISRLDSDEDPGFKSVGRTYHDWTNISASRISTVTSILKEKLAYPYTSLAKVHFSSKEFQTIPQRTYHLKGLLVQVPSNYVTREEASNGVANYNRNVSTGAIESSYQDWDGNFRESLVYTNNPAWIFYDILKNNRYGLGDFISPDEIDKFSLYRIARYCDELVDDGKGGQEPRYTLNTYLTKQADAYKVLKDLSTTFLGMLYFLDGKILTSIDAPSSPIYTFTKANVVDGSFSYENTGSKTRTNQVVVQWNDPDSNYALQPLIVEDKRNISETERIISTTVQAVGCTSEGQATRYGKWKLWTAANQQEIVSFSTGINGSYITPGDIINVQDSDRYATRYGGRISNTGTLSTTVIPLDSSVVLNSGSTYTLDVIIVEPAAFLTQATSAVIGGTTYNTGDLVPSVDTEEESYNTTDDSGNPVSLSWKDNFRTESRTVSTSAGTVTSLTVSSAFSQAPSREDIWVLTETKEGLNVDGSAKEYKVLAIAQSGKNIYDITAVEHYNIKYSSIEKDFTTYVPESLAQIIKPTDIVPEVIDATVSLVTTGTNENLKLRWIPPAANDYSVKDEDGNITTVNISGRYEFLHGFEISHNIPNYDTPIRVDKNRTEFLFQHIGQGDYIIAIRTINTLENKSSPKIINVQTRPDFEDILVRYPKGIPVGGSASINTAITSGGIFGFQNNVYGYRPPQPNGAPFSSTSSTSADYQQDCSGLSQITWTAQTNSGEFIHEHHYILFQSDRISNPMRLMKYNKTPSHGVPYWFDAGTGAETTGLTNNLTGTVTKAANRSVVTGTNTSFTTELAVGALFVVGTEAAIVSVIDSDTTLYLDTPSSTAYSGSNFKTNNYHFDYTNDAIIARVYKTSAGFHLQSLIGLDSTLTPQQAITRTIYRKNSNVIDDDVGTFSDPLDGNSDWSLGIPALTADGDVIYASTRTLTSDGNPPQDSTWSTPVVYAQRADGSNGVDARAVSLSTPTQAITYDAAGSNPTPSAAFNITATALNTAGTPYYDFIVDGTSQQNGTGNTYSYTPPSAHSSMPDVIRVDLREGSTTETVLASDTLTIYGVKPGTDGTEAYTVILTNEAHTLPTTNTGTVTYTGSGTTISVFKGTTELSSVAYDATPTTGEFAVTTHTGSNITPDPVTDQDVSNKPVIIGDHSSMNATNATVTYTINIEGSVTATKTQSLAKSVEGGDGLDGVKTALIYAYQRSSTALTSNPGAVTVNLNNGTITTSPLDNSWSATIPSGTDPLYIVAASAAGTGSTDTVAANEWSSPVILSQNGDDGDDGLNSATVYIYKKTNSATESSKPSGDTTYTFQGGGVAFTNANGWSATIPSGTQTYLWARTATAAATTATDTIADTEWSSAELLSVQGTDGDNGLRTVHGNLYYEDTSGSAPSAPSGTTYTFSTGKVSGTGINDAGTTNTWKNEPNTQDATATNTYYILTYFGTEASAGSSTLTVTYGTVKTHTNFTGVVTFTGTGKELSDGTTSHTFIEGTEVNSNVTSISGGVIQAGSTIEVGATGNNRAGLTGAAANGTQQDTDVRIYSGAQFSNRANAPFSVTQEGKINAEFGTIGGFSVGIDSLISNSENPLITLGSDLTSNPEKQITLSARAEDDFLLYAGIAVPTDGTGIKQSDNPPFSVDEDGNVIMRSFELRDEANVTLMDSTNLLSDVLVSQIGASLGGGIAAVSFDESTPNNHFELQLSEAQNVQIDFEIDSGGPHVSGVTTSISDALNSIMPQVAVEVEYRVKGTSTWNTFGSVTLTGVSQAGSQPTLSSTQYWINAESYTARTMATYYRSQIEFGYGCITDQGNFQGSVQQENLAANTYEVRINSLTTADKNITVTARTHNPTGTYVLDYGYGVYGTQSTTGAQVINSPRNFTVKSYASGGYLKKDKWNVTIGSSPKVVKDSVTFADFLPLGGGTMLGPITLEDTLTGGVVFPASTGPDMVMYNTSGAGYNHIFFRTETTTPTIAASLDSYGNLVLGNDLTMGRDLDVQGTTSPTWSYNTSPVSYVSITQEGSLHTDGGLSVTGDAIINNDVFIHGPLVLGWSASRPGEIIFQNAQQGTNKMSILYGPDTSATTKFLDIQYNDVSEFRFESDGDFHADGNITAYSATISSDEKLKDNIEVIEGALDTLEGIKGVTFEWKKDGKKAGGVIAQDIEKVFPRAVSETETLDGKDTFKTVDYNQIIGILVESVKELKAEIAELKRGK